MSSQRSRRIRLSTASNIRLASSGSASEFCCIVRYAAANPAGQVALRKRACLVRSCCSILAFNAGVFGCGGSRIRREVSSLVPRDGFEPPPPGSSARRSTAELPPLGHGGGPSGSPSKSCVCQVQQIAHVERVLVGFQVNSSIPLFDRK